MKVALYLRSTITIIAQIGLICFVFIFERAVGIPLVSCFTLILLAPRISAPHWLILYGVVTALFMSSVLSLSWTMIFGAVTVVLFIAQYFGRKRTIFFLIWLAVIFSAALFVLAGGILSGGVVIYWLIALFCLAVVSRHRRLSKPHSQTWYIR